MVKKLDRTKRNFLESLLFSYYLTVFSCQLEDDSASPTNEHDNMSCISRVLVKSQERSGRFHCAFISAAVPSYFESGWLEKEGKHAFRWPRSSSVLLLPPCRRYEVKNNIISLSEREESKRPVRGSFQAKLYSSLEFIIKYAQFFIPWFVKTINCSRCLNVPCNPGASSLLLKWRKCRKLK